MFRGIIYSYKCTINNKYYIGQTIDEKRRRWEFLNNEKYCTLRSCNKLSKFDKARKKYGLDIFEYQIIEELFLESSEELSKRLNELEVYYIKEYDSFKNGYNSTEGGLNGKLSKETRNKISNSLKGRPMSELTYQKICLTGYPLSEEAKEKISKAAKNRYKNPENHPMYGKHHSEESKLKNSNSRKGKCTGKENKNSRAVEAYDLQNNFLEKFDCMIDAVKWVNKTYNKTINPRQCGQICNCCKGKIKTAYGLIWKYVN